MEKPRKYHGAGLPTFAKTSGRRATVLTSAPVATTPRAPVPAAPAAAPLPSGPQPVSSFDLNDFKGAFSFDDFFNRLVGPLAPLGGTDLADGGAQVLGNGPGSLGLGPGGVPMAAGFPESDALLPRFKEARSMLLDLSRRVDDKLDRLRKDVAAQDSEHKETLAKLEMGVEGLFDSFGRLDQRISGVGQTAARIGDHLQSADAQRETASQIIELIKHLMDFNRSTEDFTPSAPVFSDDKRMGEAAAIAQKLRALAEEDEDTREIVPGEGRRGGPSASPGMEVAVHNLEEYCNDLENKLLQKFDAASERRDLAAMAECAKILEQFQRGSRAINRYVATRPMFMDVKVMQADIRIATGETGVSIAAAGATNPTRGLTNLYKSIIDTIKEESVVVTAVFSSPKSVMKILTQRVLEQRVHNVLEHLLKDPGYLLDNPPPVEPSGGLLTYLRILASAYEKTVELSKQLQVVGCGDLDVEGTVEGLFSLHKDLYSEVEQASLMQQFQAKYAGEMSGTAALSATSSGSSDTSSGAKSRGAQSAAAGAATAAGGTAGLVAECVRWNEEAVTRCKVLTPEAEAVVENVGIVFGVLLDQVNEYTKAMLKRANSALAEAAALRDKFSIGTAVSRRVAQAAAAAAEQAALAGEQSIRTFLTAVKRASGNVATVQQHFTATVGPVLSLVDGAQTKALDEMAAKMGEAEGMVLRGLQVCIESITGEVERVLQAEQKATEFKPPEDGALPDNRPTTACIKVKAYLERIVDAVVTSLEGPNRSAFLEEVGCNLHRALLTHIQKFQFNTGGGLRLKRDVSEYTDFVRAFKSHAVDEQFEALSALVNLFIVPPDSLRKLVDSLNLSHKDALVYMQLRDDFRSARIAAQFSK